MAHSVVTEWDIYHSLHWVYGGEEEVIDDVANCSGKQSIPW